jgi:hypothetical protein
VGEQSSGYGLGCSLEKQGSLGGEIPLFIFLTMFSHINQIKMAKTDMHLSRWFRILKEFL